MFEIINNEAIAILHTGGTGWSVCITFVGITLIAGGCFFLLNWRHDEKKKS